MSSPAIQAIAPFFIVADVGRSIGFYRDRLGFQVAFAEPAETPFFAILNRDGATLFVKQGGAGPLPNPVRDPGAKWDAYLYAPDPEALAAEFTASAAPFRTPLGVTSENLLGFEIADPDGYVLFFGWPRE
jgi:catechol 2,3-dioxygenase-like lactoylglutathione lyase family enzyme